MKNYHLTSDIKSRKDYSRGFLVTVAEDYLICKITNGSETITERELCLGWPLLTVTHEILCEKFFFDIESGDTLTCNCYKTEDIKNIAEYFGLKIKES